VRYIHEQIRSGRYPNCSTLAAKFELSTRTIDRDMEAMRNSLDLPLAFSFERNGYYYTREVPSDLPRPKLTEGDTVAFCLARRALERFRGTDFAERFEEALQKITDEVEGKVLLVSSELDELVSFGPRGATRGPAQEIAAAVSEALLLQRELELLYWNLAGHRHEPRRIQPLHLRALGDTLFLFAIDARRADGKVRTFVLSRMKKVRVSKRSFARPKGFDPDEEMRHSVGAYHGAKPERVRLRLSALATRLLDERPLHTTQKIVLTKRTAANARKGAAATGDASDGPSVPLGSPQYCHHAELTMKVAITPELEREILYWGADVQVLEPPSLRGKIAEIARVVAGKKGR
jgi:predicted DNA-binding transcriptional regulator YafY